jgi:hypothetical protein
MRLQHRACVGIRLAVEDKHHAVFGCVFAVGVAGADFFDVTPLLALLKLGDARLLGPVTS